MIGMKDGLVMFGLCILFARLLKLTPNNSLWNGLEILVIFLTFYLVYSLTSKLNNLPSYKPYNIMSKYASKLTGRLPNDLPVRKLGFLEAEDVVLTSENDELARALISSTSSERSKEEEIEKGLFGKFEIPKIHRAVEQKVAVLVDREIDDVVQVLTNRNQRPKVLARVNDEIEKQKVMLQERLSQRKDQWNQWNQWRESQESDEGEFRRVIEGMKQILVEKDKYEIEERNRKDIEERNRKDTENRKREEMMRERELNEKEIEMKEKEQRERINTDREIVKDEEVIVIKDDLRYQPRAEPNTTQTLKFEYDMPQSVSHPPAPNPSSAPFQVPTRTTISIRPSAYMQPPISSRGPIPQQSLSMDLEPSSHTNIAELECRSSFPVSDSMEIIPSSLPSAPFPVSNPLPVVSTYSLKSRLSQAPSQGLSKSSPLSIEDLRNKIVHAVQIKDNLLKSIDKVLTDNRKEFCCHIFSLSVSRREFDEKYISAVLISIAKGGDTYSNKNRILFISYLIDSYLESQFPVDTALNMCDTILNLLEVLAKHYSDLYEIFLTDIMSRHNIMLPLCAKNENEAMNRNNLADLGFIRNRDVKLMLVKSMNNIKCLGMLLGVYYKRENTPYSLEHAWEWFKRLREIPVNLMDRNYIPALIGMLEGCGQELLYMYKQEFVDLINTVRNSMFVAFQQRVTRPEYSALMSEVQEILRNLTN